MTKRTAGAAKAAPHSDPGQYLPALARAAADKMRARKTPMSRSAALAATPWDASMPPAWERETRAAFADRLVERGLALPAREGGASGASGTTDLVQCKLYLSKAEQAAQKATAKAAGLSWSTWARRKLAQP
jgi:hypothetical protein